MRTFERSTQAITSDQDGIAQVQTPSGAGDLTLNGVAVVADSGSYYTGKALLDPPRRVHISTIGDESGRVFTIYGTDRMSNEISESVTGPNAATAISNQAFKSVSRIAIDGAAAAGILIGWGTEYISPWIILGNARGHYNASWQLAVNGTVNCAIEASYRNILRERLTGDYEPDAVDILTPPLIADAVGVLETPVAAVRLVQLSGTGNAVLRIVPSRSP